MKLTDIVILGILNRARRHGYDIKKEIETEMQNVDVQFGSIYHALKKFTEEGLIQRVAIPPSEPGRPDRKGYAITAAGQDRLQQLLRGALTSAPYSGDALDAAIHFLSMLPQQDVISLLEQRVRTLDILQNQLQSKAAHRSQDMLSQIQSRKPAHLTQEEQAFWKQEYARIPQLVHIALTRQLAHLKAEQRWVQDTLELLKSNQ